MRPAALLRYLPKQAMIPLMAPMPAYRGQIAPARTFPLWQIAALRVILVRISAQTWVSRGHKYHKHLPLCARCARRLPGMAAPSSLAPADDNYLASKKQPGLQASRAAASRLVHTVASRLLDSRVLLRSLHEIRCYDANI